MASTVTKSYSVCPCWDSFPTQTVGNGPAAEGWHRAAHYADYACSWDAPATELEAFRRSVDAANQDWVLIRQFAADYRADLHRLNKETGELRDGIRDNCGLPGRQWYDALMKRTQDRRDGLL